MFARRHFLWFGISVGLVVGLGRNIQGNHYLSDVVFAFWLVYGCALVLARYYDLSLRNHLPARSDDRK